MPQDVEGALATLAETLFPHDLVVETIAGCNLRCVMCPLKTLARPKGLMSIDLWRRIIREVKEKSPSTRIWPSLMGDISLMAEDFYRMASEAVALGLDLRVNTNGYAYTPRSLDSLINTGCREIIVGIDGATKETYEKIRVGSEFEKVVRNIEYLITNKKSGQTITVQFIQMEENENEVPAFVDMWSKRGPVKIKIRHRLGWGTTVGSNRLNYRGERIPCPWLIRSSTIAWDGRYLQCDSDHNGVYSPGNFMETSISDMWNGPLKIRRDRHWNRQFDFDPCEKCNDWQVGISYTAIIETEPK